MLRCFQERPYKLRGESLARVPSCRDACHLLCYSPRTPSSTGTQWEAVVGHQHGWILQEHARVSFQLGEPSPHNCGCSALLFQLPLGNHLPQMAA